MNYFMVKKYILPFGILSMLLSLQAHDIKRKEVNSLWVVMLKQLRQCLPRYARGNERPNPQTPLRDNESVCEGAGSARNCRQSFCCYPQ